MKNQGDDTSDKPPTNIRALHGASVNDARKQQFLDFVAQAYDEFVKANNDVKEDVAFMLFNFVGDKGTSVTRYLAPGSEEHMTSLYAARSVFIINYDAAEWEGEA